MKLTQLFFFFFLSHSLFSQTLQVQNLQCEYRTNPLGVDAWQPRLSWQITSTGRDIIQSSYRIIVADNPGDIQQNLGNTWDSKKVNSNQSIQVNYRGPKLQAAKTYYWKVMVWDNKKMPHPGATTGTGKWVYLLPLTGERLNGSLTKR